MKANLLLLLTAFIWGFAFVAQRAGMEYIGPFTFNAARFTIGSLSLIPLLIINRKKKFEQDLFVSANNKTFFYGSLSAGLFLFMGVTLQQTGLVYTSAGKGGFITGFYIILVPILGLLVKQKTSLFTWFGALIAIVGLYFLSVNKELEINIGDILILIAAFFWAGQILVIAYYSTRIDSIQLAFAQFLFCALLSFISAVIFEVINFNQLFSAIIPVLYAGIFSAGIAFTLQIIAQREAHPANAAIIMSLESVFAVLGGWLILSETIPLRGLFGCLLMLAGMIISQVYLFNRKGKIK